MPGFGFGGGRHRRAGNGAGLPNLNPMVLSANSLSENSAAGTFVGTLSGRTTGSTLTLLDNAGSRFALSGLTLSAGSVATDYETATSHVVTVREALSGYVTRDTSFTIGVVNVFEQPNLAALNLSATSFTIGTSASGTISGATVGSAITASGLPTGLTINGAARTWAYDGTGSAATSTVTLTETLADSANSPRSSNVSVTVATAGGAVPVNSVAPVQTWTGEVGETATVSTGTWSNSPTGYGYQWRWGTTNISGATAATYTPLTSGGNLNCLVTASNASGAGTATASNSIAAAAIRGISASTISTLTGMVQYHPNSQTGTTVLSGGRVQSAADLKGNAGLTAVTVSGASYTGPQQLTDLLGRTFWRFSLDANGKGQVLALAAAFVGSKRGITVFMVGRIHRGTTSNAIFNLGGSTSTAALEVACPTIATACVPRTGNRPMANTDTNFANLVSGSQLHLIGAASRPTASGGIVYFLNNYESATLAQAGTEVTGVTAEIGRNGTAWGMFDLYEFVAVPGTVTDTQARAIRDGMMTNYQIPAVTDQLLILGDSISAGVQGSDDSGKNSSMWLSEPGAGFLPRGMRCVNNAVSGYETLNIIQDRDAAQSWSATVISGGKNVVAMEIGTNDMGATNNFTAAKVTTTAGSNVITLTTAPTFLADGFHGMLDGSLIYGTGIPDSTQITLASGTRNAVGSTYTMTQVDSATPQNATASGTNVTLTGARGSTDTYGKAGQSLVAIINTATTGLLQRGWSVRALVNIASSSAAKYIELQKYRAKMEAASFLTDCQAGPGQTYDGKVSIIKTYTIKDGGVYRFYTPSDANNLTYFLADNTHPTADPGARIRVRGGDDPTLAISYGL